MSENIVSSKVILKRVRSKNFRSVGNSFVEVDLQKQGSTLVVSVDNGAGKSTTSISALYYGLFDKAYGEKARKTSLVNSKSNKDSLVEVEFEAKGREYLVRRGQKPTVFQVFEDGEEWKNDAALGDNQQRLLDVLGFDHVIFENVIALGKDRFVPFIKMDAATRRHVADKMLNTGIFGTMNEVAKEDLKEINRKISDNEFEANTVEQKLGGVERLIAQHNTNRDEIVGAARSRVEELEGEVAKKGEMRTRLDEKRQETAREAAEAADNLSVVQNRLNEVEQQCSLRVSGHRTQVDAEIRRLSDARSNTLRSIAAEQRTRVEQATQEGRRLVQEASDKLTRMKGIQGDLQRKAQGEITKATNFRALGDCPTCMQVVGDEHKDRIAGAMEKTAADVNDGLARLGPKLTEAEEALQAAKDSERAALNAIEAWADEESQKAEALGGRAVTDRITEDMNKELDNIRSEFRSIAEELEKERAPLMETSQGFVTRLNELGSAIASLDGQISVLQAELTTQRGVIERNLDQGADEQLKKLESEKSELMTRKGDLTDQYNELKTEARHYSELLIMLKDTGVKADVVKQYIPFFNRRVNELLDAMGIYINFVMDEDFNIDMMDPTRKNQNLYDLSTGQQRRIDLAILFVWREIAQKKSSVSCNLLILDEVLENLSQQGVVDFMGMFENHLSEGTNLMVITQREDEFSEYFDHLIKYKLVDDFTVLLDKAE